MLTPKRTVRNCGIYYFELWDILFGIVGYIIQNCERFYLELWDLLFGIVGYIIWNNGIYIIQL